jgi:hypothetical protein
MGRNLRQPLRQTLRAFGVLAVPDTGWPAPSEGGLLLSCHDVDRGMRDEAGRRFSPLLAGIGHLAARGRAAHHLAHPWTALPSREVTPSTLMLNRRMLRARLRAWLERRPGARLVREAAIYRRLLQTLRPAFAFAIQPPAGLCVAARECGVPLAEVMHGTHVSLSDRIWADYFGRPETQVAPLVISFDDVTHASVSTWAQGRDIRTVRARDPWLLTCRHLGRRGQGGGLPGRRERRALVTLQWGYDGERAAFTGIVPDGVLHPALAQAFAAGAQRGWNFLVRLHPIQMTAPGYRHHRNRIAALAAQLPNVEMTQATSWPLPLLLDEVAAHVTMCSSAVGEASAAGVRSLALCPTLLPGGAHEDLFRELRDAGTVTLGHLDAGDILTWLDRCSPPPPRDTAADEREHEDALRFYERLLAHPTEAGT